MTRTIPKSTHATPTNPTVTEMKPTSVGTTTPTTTTTTIPTTARENQGVTSPRENEWVTSPRENEWVPTGTRPRDNEGTIRPWENSIREVFKLALRLEHSKLKSHNRPTAQNAIGWSSWGQWSACRVTDTRKCIGTRIRSRTCLGRCSRGSARDNGICQARDHKKQLPYCD